MNLGGRTLSKDYCRMLLTSLPYVGCYVSFIVLGPETGVSFLACIRRLGLRNWCNERQSPLLEEEAMDSGASNES